MALTPNFSASQTLGLPQDIILTDTSTGSDGAITARRVYLLTSQGTYLTANGEFTTSTYTTWNYSDSTITIDCLQEDTALSITVLWVDTNGVTLYTKTIPYAFTMNGETFYYSLSQNQASSQPQIINDTFYYNNKMILRVLLDSANNAITYGSDIYTSQAMLTQSTYMINNSTDYF